MRLLRNEKQPVEFRHLFCAISVIFLLFACTAGNEQVQKQTEINIHHQAEPIPAATQKTAEVSADASPAATKAREEAPAIPDIKEAPAAPTEAEIAELRRRLATKGVPEEWFDSQLRHETFQIHPAIACHFQNSVEKMVDQDKKYDASWYFAKMDVAAKIEKGKKFLETNGDIFRRAENKNGIHRELIAAVIGIETNFASNHQRGKFYAFNSLVSQYVFAKRKKFAVREITALYKFSEKIGQPPQYFTSSYAGAIGWGQFIPSSLLAFFIDANGINKDTDPFCIEDTIFSVENYLHKHNLSGKNINDYNARYKAVFAYNHSDVYVKAVLFIYDGLRGRFLPPEQKKPFRESAHIEPR